MATPPQAAPKLNVHKLDEGHHTLLRFAGVIDEDYAGSEMAASLEARVLVIDLSGVKRLTSFGIREWVRFIEQAGKKCQLIYLVDCAPRVVVQLNMVVRFVGRATVLSVMAPYLCEGCGAAYERRLDMMENEQAIRSFAPRDDTCPTCAGNAVFDDDPARYFSHLADQPRPNVPSDTAAFLSRHLADFRFGASSSKISVVKLVEQEHTIIRLLGEIDGSLPVEQLIEGLEGELALDLSSVTRLVPSGNKPWTDFIAGLLGRLSRVRLFGCTPALISPLRGTMDQGSALELHSAMLPYRCEACSTSSQHEVDVGAETQRLSRGTAPELLCRDCEAPLRSIAEPTTLVEISETAAPEPAPEVAALVQRARESAATTLEPDVEEPPAPQRRSISWAWVIVGSATVGALVAVLILTLMPDKPKPVAPRARYYEASHLAAPPWRDKKLFFEGTSVVTVARSTLSMDKATAFAESSHAASDEMLAYVLRQISRRDKKWAELIGKLADKAREAPQKRLAATYKGDKEQLEKVRRAIRRQRQRVVQSWAETSRALVPPVSDATYWESYRQASEQSYRVWTRARLSKANAAKAVDYYSTRHEALGVTVVPFFPLLCWKLEIDRGAVVIETGEGILRSAGVRVGEVVSRLNSHLINDGVAFEKLAKQTLLTLRSTGGELKLELMGLDGKRRNVKTEIAKVVRRGPSPGSGAPKEPGPANIWNDDPSK